MALLARGTRGLDGAANDVRLVGGTALCIETDVADAKQVQGAADKVESETGPIDVSGVNVAFTLVFAPFDQIQPDEYKRVTEVAYLGYVYGTMNALRYMKGRDRGTIVQVGSALAYRGSAPDRVLRSEARYSGLQRGTALRTAAREEQCPCDDGADAGRQYAAVLLGPVPPSPTQPRQFHRSTSLSWPLAALSSQLTTPSDASIGSAHRQLAHLSPMPLFLVCWTDISERQDSRLSKPQRCRILTPPVNLWEPADGHDGKDFGAHGVFDKESHDVDPQLWLSHHHKLLRLALVSLAGFVFALTRRR